MCSRFDTETSSAKIFRLTWFLSVIFQRFQLIIQAFWICVIISKSIPSNDDNFNEIVYMT